MDTRDIKLPSNGFLSSLLTEGWIVTKLHLASQLTSSSGDLVLHTDGTTRGANHLNGFQFSQLDGVEMYMSVHNVSSTTASSTCHDLEAILDELVTIAANYESAEQQIQHGNYL